MVLNTKIFRAIKYSSLIGIAAYVGAYLSIFYYPQPKPDTIIQFEDDFQYFPDVAAHFSTDMLTDDFDSCFFESFVTDVEETDSKSISFVNYNSYETFNETGAEQKIIKHSIIKVLTEFADLMSHLKIKVVLIEPSLIYCMLSSVYKRILLKRNFKPEVYFKTNQVVTFGIRDKYIKRIGKAKIQTKIREANFSIEVVRDPSPKWVKGSKNFTKHLLFKRNSVTVHAVVFHKRASYLWHSKFESDNDNVPERSSLHFANSDAAYDSFDLVRPGFKTPSLSNVLIPSDPYHFLFQISTSRFVECDSEVVERYRRASSSALKGKEMPSPVDKHRFRVKFVSAVRMLKRKFRPLLMRFFMWSGTMLGWYRQCDLIPYTSDVDFAAWAEEVEDLDTLLRLFEDDDHLKLRERMGVVQQALEFNLNCHGRRVDIFFIYPESNGTWYAGHRPSKKYFFKYHTPKFSLCSADLLGEKVLVPCETESVIKNEYGPKWMKPVTSWNYEKSIFNRGPNIYWNESMLKEVYD